VLCPILVPQYKRHMDVLDTVQLNVCEDEGTAASLLESWDCSAWRRESSSGISFNVYKYLKGGWKEDGARLFSVMPSDATRSNGHKLKYRRLTLNIGKHFFYCEGD